MAEPGTKKRKGGDSAHYKGRELVLVVNSDDTVATVGDDMLHAMAKRIAYSGIVPKSFWAEKMAHDQQVEAQIREVDAKWNITHHPPLKRRKRLRPVRSTDIREDALNFTVFTPKGIGPAPVLAFGGSDTVGDWLTDFEPQYPGYTQFSKKNQQYIKKHVAADLKKWLEREPTDKDYRQLVLTGHSLGGALAQMAAVKLYPECAAVVTFQTVGVGSPLSSFSERRFAKPGDRNPAVRHYMAFGGIVSAAGPKLLGGQCRLRGLPRRHARHADRDLVALHRMNLIPLGSRYHNIVRGDPYAKRMPPAPGKKSWFTAREVMERTRGAIGRALTQLRRHYHGAASLKELNDVLQAKVKKEMQTTHRPASDDPERGLIDFKVGVMKVVSDVLKHVRKFITAVFTAAIEAIDDLVPEKKSLPIVQLTTVVQFAVVRGYDECVAFRVDAGVKGRVAGIEGKAVLLPAVAQFAYKVQLIRNALKKKTSPR